MLFPARSVQIVSLDLAATEDLPAAVAAVVIVMFRLGWIRIILHYIAAQVVDDTSIRERNHGYIPVYICLQ